MTAQAITIAITDGVPADQIGRGAASLLGFRYVNDEIISRAAQRVGVTPEEVADVERSKSLMEQILAALGRAGGVLDETGMGAEALPPMADESPAYREMIRQVIWETGKTGQVVIGAHGAGIHLASMNGVLRVLLTGTPEARAARLASDHQIGLDQARKQVDRGDRARASYLKRFYGINRELPTHYDLVLNLDGLPVPAAVEAITRTAQRIS